MLLSAPNLQNLPEN